MAKVQKWIEVRIPVDVEGGGEGLFYVTSSLLKGLLVAERSEEAALDRAREAIEHLGTAKYGGPR